MKKKITKYFTEIETTKEYDGYFCSVEEAITIVILGSFCGLKNANQIHQWTEKQFAQQAKWKDARTRCIL